MFFKRNKISDNMIKTLATKNFKHSIKEYLVYFITLIFGVVLLYSFNSIDDTLKLLGGNNFFESTLIMVRGIFLTFSIIICIIFGFLIAYANNFLMRKRKKEFGIYITLGMNKNNVNKLLFKEIVLIGCFSLAVGLILGLFVSQGITMLAFKMLGFSLSTYKFSFSIIATVKTIVFFILILFFINRFNKKNMSKLKLIDLIHSNEKTEMTINSSNKFKNICFFLISILFIMLSYLGLLYISFVSNSYFFIGLITISIFFIIIGTYLLFGSVSCFILKGIHKFKKIYYNKLNVFIINQIASRIKTLSLSMTMICLLLFSSMIIIPYGLSMGKSFSEDLHTSTPFDASIVRYDEEPDLNLQMVSKKLTPNYKSFKEVFEESNFPIVDTVSSISQLREYTLSNIKLDIFAKGVEDNYLIPIIPLTDYNSVRKQQGLTPIDLKKDQFIINYNNKKFEGSYKNYLTTEATPININGITLRPVKELYSTTLYSSEYLDSYGEIIVPDYTLRDLMPIRSILNINYLKRNNINDNMFMNAFVDFSHEYDNFNYNIASKIYIDGEKLSLATIFSFMAIYLGIILLISAGAILTLQQIAEINSVKENFNLLRKLGAREKLIKKSIILQVSMMFLFPFVIAIVNSSIVYIILSKIIPELIYFNITKNIITTIIIITTIYGVYFMLSLIESFKVINNE